MRFQEQHIKSTNILVLCNYVYLHKSKMASTFLLFLISATSSYFQVITSVWLDVYNTKVHIKYDQTLFKDNLLFQSPVAREKNNIKVLIFTDFLVISNLNVLHSICTVSTVAFAEWCVRQGID